MEPRMLKDQLKMGNVQSFLVERENFATEVYLQLRRSSHFYKLNRFFPSIAAAVNYLVKAIDKPIFDGLSPEWRAIPPITIKSNDRGYYEKDKHEQASKQEAIPQGSKS